MDKILEYQTIRKLRNPPNQQKYHNHPPPSITPHPRQRRTRDRGRPKGGRPKGGRNPHLITNIPSSFRYLLRTQKALHIPNPIQPSQIRADSGVLVLERDELVVGIAAAPKRMSSVRQSNVMRRDNL